jgi:hypothetical protein
LQHLREAHDKDTGSWVQNLACLAPCDPKLSHLPFFLFILVWM